MESFSIFNILFQGFRYFLHCLNVSPRNNFGMYFLRWPGVQLSERLRLSFLSNFNEYDRSDSFPFDYDPNGFPFLFIIKRKTVTTIRFLSICTNSETNNSLSMIDKKKIIFLICSYYEPVLNISTTNLLIYFKPSKRGGNVYKL